MLSCQQKDATNRWLAGRYSREPLETCEETIDAVLQMRCNRATKLRLQLPKDLLLVDSTTITEVRPGFLGRCFTEGVQGTSFTLRSMLPPGNPSTSWKPLGRPMMVQTASSLAYGKIKRFDQYVQDKQYFVTRIKENATLVTPHSLK